MIREIDTVYRMIMSEYARQSAQIFETAEQAMEQNQWRALPGLAVIKH